MVVSDIYNEFPYRLQTNDVSEDLTDSGNDVYVALLDDSHSPDLGEDAVFDDVSADEITETGANDDGYTAGGETISNFSITSDSADRVVDADGDDVTWSDSTIDAGYAVVYNDADGTETNQDLIMLIDFEGEQSSENADFTIEWDSDGIYRFSTDP